MDYEIMEFDTIKFVFDKKPLGFDFSKKLGNGETITTAVFSNVSIDKTDSNDSAMLLGVENINLGIVMHMLQNGIAGNKYKLSVVITTSGGRTLYAEGIYKVK